MSWINCYILILENMNLWFLFFLILNLLCMFLVISTWRITQSHKYQHNVHTGYTIISVTVHSGYTVPSGLTHIRSRTETWCGVPAASVVRRCTVPAEMWCGVSKCRHAMESRLCLRSDGGSWALVVGPIVDLWFSEHCWRVQTLVTRNVGVTHNDRGLWHGEHLLAQSVHLSHFLCTFAMLGDKCLHMVFNAFCNLDHSLCTLTAPWLLTDCTASVSIIHLHQLWRAARPEHPFHVDTRVDIPRTSIPCGQACGHTQSTHSMWTSVWTDWSHLQSVT